ncbi:hypothetical protein D9756_004003 [Leucocoprinus leucothites]|uniref:Major facilitator superfamily (MFS) profile domain-containing protein n=1 Tax=Leucocoprinus leucothites TaxID=201217 RepID=A0A8H5D8R3_9AGAR|nr:hypothetical protein D9756_004003 [Leucoagaricus leucothites]
MIDPLTNGPSAANASSVGRSWGLEWRSSYWFSTYVIGLGIAIDVIVYSIVVPVVPFQLEHLGYTGISALSGWLLFAYSGGLLVSYKATIPVAMWSEHYNARKYPMLAGLGTLIASQILFMEAPSFAVMCVARIIQGIGSSVVWVVGLAFLCDATPQEIIGRQIGLVMSGLSFGLVLGPPVGGLLYSHFGFRGPFIFTLIGATIDLASRAAIIEPKEARKWGMDTTRRLQLVAEPSKETPQPGAEGTSLRRPPELQPEIEIEGGAEGPVPGSCQGHTVVGSKEAVEKSLPLLQVMLRLSKSSRALVALVISFVYSSQEPALPLHLQSVWGMSSQKVGVFLLALSVPMLISSPVTGWLTDKVGAEWVAATSIVLAIPWWGVITIDGPLALFGVAFALENFFTSGVISPLTAELAAVSRNIQGVGYAHIYAAFNVAYGIGTTIGPIVGGQAGAVKFC